MKRSLRSKADNLPGISTRDCLKRLEPWQAIKGLEFLVGGAVARFRMVQKHRIEHTSQWAAVVSIAVKMGSTAQTLNEWLKRTDVDSGRKLRVTSDERERLKTLERQSG